RAMAANDLEGVPRQRRVLRPNSRLGRLARIAVAYQGIKVGKDGRCDQQVGSAEQTGLECGALAQQADHQLRCLLCTWVGERFLPCWQPLLPTAPRANESWSNYRSAPFLGQGIHQAEADVLDEVAGIIQGAHQTPVEAPLLLAPLLKFLLSHTRSRQQSAVSIQPPATMTECWLLIANLKSS